MRLLFTAIISVLGFVSVSAQAKNYYVEPMICKGKWNKQPPGYHPDYTWAGMKVISFWSVRARDCSTVASSSTQAEYGSTSEDIVFDRSMDLGTWFGVPLKQTGKKVVAPFGVWPDDMELEITHSEKVNGVQTDTLQGRYILFEDYHYTLDCTAVVVGSPKHIQNNTKNCKRP